MIKDKAPDYEKKFENIKTDLQDWTQKNSLPMPTFSGDSGQVFSVAGNLLKKTLDVLTWLTLLFAFLFLGLAEVWQYQYKVQHNLQNRFGNKIFETTGDIAHKFRQYVLARTIASGLTAILTAIFAWAIGLDLPIVWGVLTFLLNYVPTLGSFVGVTLITLFGLFQEGTITFALLALFGAGSIQLILGAYVDPLIQGRALSLSPLLVLFVISFWGWLWGIPGALIGVPITSAMLIAFDQFERTRWITGLLVEVRSREVKENQQS